MINKYPIFVISYNRPQRCKTSKWLAEYEVLHYLILHKEQIEEYKKHLTEKQKKYTTILEFDETYKYKYETCDDIPHRVKNAGSGAERNFAWDYAKKLGHKAHWLMDDNMMFYHIVGRNAKNIYVRKRCQINDFQEKFKKAENFFDKYENLLMLELAQKDFFFNVRQNTFALNTRCFSCNLIYNDMPLRWRGRYNEDVILSTDVMVSGYCIASYIGGVLKSKESTRCAVGGNHAKDKNDKESLYSDAENYKFSSVDKTNLLMKVYPQYYRKVIKYGRVHHEYNRKELKKMNGHLKLIPAKFYGEKRIKLQDFKKVKHYKIPE
ncbi:MAG: hypothetical protein IKU37_08680 [Candidatus Gastranaerophilales bacterium]|nr:hypothetical protein [Candidatus Gastranaerophilales bacterium]